MTAVGELSINNTPAAVKNFAIREFGSNDKTVLVWGIRGVLIIFAAMIGVLAIRKLWLGMAGLAVFGAIGIYAALSQPTAKGSDVLPSLIGAGVAAFALRYFSALARRLALPAPPPRQLASRPGEPPAPTPSRLRTPRAACRHGGTPWTGGPLDEVQGRAGLEPAPNRRKFLLAGAAVAGVSLITYAGGSWLANTRDVNAIQRALKLPPPARPAPPLPPGTDLKIPGLSSFITPNSSFYRVDTAIVAPGDPARALAAAHPRHGAQGTGADVRGPDQAAR